MLTSKAPTRRKTGLVILLLCMVLQALPTYTPGNETANREPPEDAARVAERWELTGALRDVLIKTLPEEYQNDKQWGKQRYVERWRWVHENGALRREKVMVPVNHGTWLRYEVELVDPNREVEVVLEKPRFSPGGLWRVDCKAYARLKLFGRLSKWVYGVQLISLNAQADARVEVVATFDFGLNWKTSNGLSPRWEIKVQEIECRVVEFRLLRVSQLHGPVVREMGEFLDDWFNRRLEQQEEQIRERLNRSLERHGQRTGGIEDRHVERETKSTLKPEVSRLPARRSANHDG